MFVDFFIRRPVFATVCALLIILAGAVVIPTLPIAQFPNLAPPQVSVSSGYVGASAQTVESAVTIPLEEARRANLIGASLQAAVTLKLAPDEAELLSPSEWAELAIVSDLRTVAGTGDEPAEITLAPGRKCDRCWRVLTEVGTSAVHPTLCLRCTDAVDAA